MSEKILQIRFLQNEVHSAVKILIAAHESKLEAIRALLPMGDQSDGAKTINQLLTALAQGVFDRVMVDPDWVEPGWWQGIFRAAQSAGCPLWFISESLEGMQSWRLDPHTDNLSQMVSQSCCWISGKDSRHILHRGEEISLGSRTIAVLKILSSATPGYLWKLEEINRHLKRHNLAVLSLEALTVHVHTLRKQLGPQHIQTERKLGYRWQPCIDSAMGSLTRRGHLR